MQSPNRKFARALPGIFAVAVLLAVSMARAASPESAPDFTLKSASGANLKLSEFRGEVVLVNFWASWCGPCRQEMPLLSELHEQYRDLGFTVLGVNVEEDTRKARKLLEDAPVSFPVLFDSDSVVSREYDVVAMPSTVLVDRNGKLRYLHKGYKPGLEAVYQQQVRDLLRE
jgi:thiol-disulfide isomerase/thioredoxin